MARVLDIDLWRERAHDWAETLGLGGESGRVRQHTLAMMRWVAIGGQLFTVLFVQLSLNIPLPLAAMLPAILTSVLLNLVLLRVFSPSARLSESSATLLFSYDIAQLCYLLLLTGGLQNPFALLLLLPVTLAAATLGLSGTVAVTMLTLTCLAGLALAPGPLPWRGGGLILPSLLLVGVWTALSMATILVASFAWTIAEEARRHADALAAIQHALAREQQLSALGGQAAAAAHLLGTPLGTINVIAKELVRETPSDSPLAEDTRELLSQVQRCRDILATLGRRPDQPQPGSLIPIPLSVLLGDIAANFARPGVSVEVRVLAEDEAREPELVLPPELRHALANLIDNAIQFASSAVQLTVRPSRQRLIVEIEDDGQGFSPDVLDWLGEPYLSTRHDNGGLGLGIFIAITLLARTGAKVHFANHQQGARVTIDWPAQSIARVGEGAGRVGEGFGNGRRGA